MGEWGGKLIANKVRIYVQSPKWFIRPANTDWRYTRFTIPRIHEFAPQCDFYVSKSLWAAFHANRRYVRRMIRNRMGLPFRYDRGSELDRAEFSNSGCELVFCHDDFPRDVGSVPVVWQNSILDPEMVRARGGSDEVIAAEHARKKMGFERAAAVHVSTEAERDRLGSWFPELADRFVAIPFLLPDAVAITPRLLEEKVERAGRLQCLFVGREARRKGLERVYAAFSKLPSSFQKWIQLVVVSDQTDGKIRTPQLPNLQVLGALPHKEVQALIRESDVLLMPSFFESYGLVYLEAMSQGTIPVVPNWEVQREIVDYGRAGIITSGDPGELALSLQNLYTDKELRFRLAYGAKARFESHFSPAVVAAKFASMFARVIEA